LLHGDMTDEEIHSLFEHPQISAFLTLTHGEGFGLPVFEAAYTGMPVIAPGWSGHLDFLVNKETGSDEFYNVEYDLQPIPENVVWEGVIIKECMWAYPRQHSAKQQMRRCFSDLTSEENDSHHQRATAHAGYLRETFAEEKQFALMVNEVCEALQMSVGVVEDEILEFG